MGVAGGALGGGDFRGCWYLETSKETSYREGRSWPGGMSEVYWADHSK